MSNVIKATEEHRVSQDFFFHSYFVKVTKRSDDYRIKTIGAISGF